ncbi:MAG: metal-dependent hydrolase [Candidatus Riflebacteria bacterium]|nr:metal-dependent hydrolase [Candidatus Riflebacteria bacterium]
MKGFTHFVSGIAVATFFPQAVHMATQDSSFILCLGGVFGIMPDTLDFKFARYFHVSEFEVWPDPKKLDAHQIASTVAAALEKANESGRSSVQLHTMQLGANLWRSYTLWFDTKNNEVVVEMGPLVDTGTMPFIGTEVKENAISRVKVSSKFRQQFDKKSNIAIMSGPCFEFVRRGENDIEIVFLPWHRTWSHSLTLGLVTSLVVGAITYFTVPEGANALLYTIPRWMLYPLIIFCGSLVHIVEDSTGFMGNNLFYPFTPDRTNGLGWMSAAEGIPNFLFVWTAFMLIIWNLDRNRWMPDMNPSGIGSTESFFFWYLAVPIALMIFFFFKGKNERAEARAKKSADKKDIGDGKPDFDGETAVERETDASIL